MENLASDANRSVIGQLSIKLWYSEEDEMLFVRLLRADILSVPSPSVIGSAWICKPEVDITLAPHKKKFWESIGKTRWVLTPSAAVYIAMKKCSLLETSLRLTCYDSKRRNDQIPIGHVFLPLKDVKIVGKSYIFNKEMMVNSEVNSYM